MSQQIELYRKLNFHKVGSPTVDVVFECTAAGLKMGNATTQKLGLYNAAPIAQQTHVADAPEITSADTAAAAAATATTIAAAVPAEPPNVDEDGIAAGGFITRAARRALVQTVIDLRTHAVEMDLDYEALLVDVADIRTKYAAAVTLANELKADVNLARTAINTILVRLETLGIVASA